MTYVPVHQELPRHRKVRKLGRILELKSWETLGLLVSVWIYAVEFSPDGIIDDADDLADTVGWAEGGDHLCAALREAEWMDGDVLHDWDEYAGRVLELKGKHAARGRSMREAYADGTIAAVRERDGDHCRYCATDVNWTDRRGPSGGTYDHVDPRGPSTIENLVVACRSCNSAKGDKPLSRTKLSLTQVGPSSDLSPVKFSSAQGVKELTNSYGVTAGNDVPADKLSRNAAETVEGWKSRDNDRDFFTELLRHYTPEHVADVMRRLSIHQSANHKYKNLRAALGNWMKNETPDELPLDDSQLTNRQRFCIEAIRGNGFDVGLTETMDEVHELKGLVFKGLTEAEVLSWR